MNRNLHRQVWTFFGQSTARTPLSPSKARCWKAFQPSALPACGRQATPCVQSPKRVEVVAKGSHQKRLIALFQLEQMLFHYLNLFGQLVERLQQLGLGGGISETGHERMNSSDVSGDLVCLVANLSNSCGSFHACTMPGAFFLSKISYS